MPLFEYVCRKCSRRFEALVMGATLPSCPACGGADLDKQFSTFAVGGGSTGRGDNADSGDAESFEETGPCGSCGDPRGPGSCAIN